MAKITLKNAVIKVSNTPIAAWTELSARAKSIRIRKTIPTKDTTCFQDAWETAATGIPSWTVAITFLQDYAASGDDNSVQNTFDTAAASSAASSYMFKADSAATGATNPCWIGQAWVTDYEPISGSLGEVLGHSVTLKGTGALTKYLS